MKKIEENLKWIPTSDIFRLAMHAGIKTNEIFALKLSDYNKSTKELFINEVIKFRDRNNMLFEYVAINKNSRRRRVILLNQFAQKAIEAAIDRVSNNTCIQEKQYLFSELNNKRILYLTIRRHSSKLKELTSLERINLSALRDNFIILCFRIGWSQIDVQEYLGLDKPQSLAAHIKIARDTNEAFYL